MPFLLPWAGLLPPPEGPTPELANTLNLAIHSPSPRALWLFGFVLIQAFNGNKSKEVHFCKYWMYTLSTSIHLFNYKKPFISIKASS